MISAKVIKDSVSEAGDRLTTMEVVCHRFVLAEFNTHRAFSRNSASSRAIPLHKQIERVRKDPAIPMVWASEKPGMSGGAEIDSPGAATLAWLDASEEAVQHAQHMADLGVHKSLCNRLLEPFMWHTIIVSATDWDGFWKQRCSPLAQPEMRLCAEAMKLAYNESTPTFVQYDQWHMPYVSERDFSEEEFDSAASAIEIVKQISAARCARVSYLTHDGVRDPSKDLDLFQKLATADPPHASPLEHVATPGRTNPSLIAGEISPKTPGNFTGWRQLRHDVFPNF